MTSMIKLLRTLGLLAGLDLAIPESIDLPIAQLEREQRKIRRRARGRRGGRTAEPTEPPRSRGGGATSRGRGFDRRGGDAVGIAHRGGLDRRGRALRDVSVRPGVRAQRHRDRARSGCRCARSPTGSPACRRTRSAVCPDCWPTPCPTAGARRSSTPGWPRRGATSRASTSFSGSATSAPAAWVRWSSSRRTSRASPAAQTSRSTRSCVWPARCSPNARSSSPS